MTLNKQPKLATYFIGRLGVLDFKQFHSPYHALHRHENVLIHELYKSTFVLVRIPCSVNNTHLFDESRLARLSSA